ncbi:MAG: AAA family ATPase [Bacillus subtilis]|nr:AAA family ATPase [Bacillus subtilis]
MRLNLAGLLKIEDSTNRTDVKKLKKDIVGSDMTKAQAMEIVKQIKNKSIGTKGIVVYADTEAGGGRRHVAEAIAGEANVPLISINGTDFSLKDYEMAQKGETPEAKITKVFKSAVAQAEVNKNKTAIIFVKDFDNLAIHPLFGYFPNEKKAFNQMLIEMENIRKTKDINVLVLGSSSHPSIHDPAIRKPNVFIDDLVVYSFTQEPKLKGGYFKLLY